MSQDPRGTETTTLAYGEGKSIEAARERMLADAGLQDAAPLYDESNLPREVQWFDARKHATTRMTRVQGPFRCLTQEGPVLCQDGYLAVDSDGYPYPIAANVFDATYRAVDAPGA